MKIEEISRNYPVLSGVVEKIKTFDRISSLYPPQEEAITSGLLENKNTLLATPTTSGKTMLAELFALKNIFKKKQKAIYLVPLKSLASEKYANFQKKYQNDINIALSIGDYDSKEPWLENYDLIICSYEKLDSLLRHNPQWIENVGTLVVDEIHMLDDPNRGPVLEVLITRLKQRCQILGLSATVKNSKELGEWLKATVVKSDFRPVKLDRGAAFYDGQTNILFENDKTQKLDGQPLDALIQQTLSQKKQMLAFVSTRKSSETLARDLKDLVSKHLADQEKIKLNAVSKQVLNALPLPTEQCKKASELIKHGVVFDHAGLMNKQKSLIEENFRKGLVKIITCTPVLAYGVSLPSYRVLLRDTKRFSRGYSRHLPVLEVHQVFGRAGRSGYDDKGEAILLAKNEKNALDLMERYICSEAEPIQSKLSVEPVLRLHVLGLIASDICNSTKSLEEFFSQTFFSHQYGELSEITKRIDKVLNMLEDYGFIEMEKSNLESNDFVPAFEIKADRKIKITKLGARVAQLYLDPVSAHKIIMNLDNVHKIRLLQTISQCTEMNISWLRQSERIAIEDELWEHDDVLEIPDPADLDYESYLKAFKNTVILNEWTKETSENRLHEKFNIPPGELYRIKTNAEWLLFSGRELAKIKNKKEAANMFNQLMLMTKHGVKKELLPFVSIKGIGRVRARKLWKAGIRKISDIKHMENKKLEELVGKKVAQSLTSSLK